MEPVELLIPLKGRGGRSLQTFTINNDKFFGLYLQSVIKVLNWKTCLKTLLGYDWSCLPGLPISYLRSTVRLVIVGVMWYDMYDLIP